MASHTAVVDGIALRWEETGEGVPVVLIHGIPTGPALWRSVVPRLVGARCLAWEMVGYGASIREGIGRDLSVGRQADYLLRWLEHIGIRQAVLAGHDLGGGVAQIAAVRKPAICSGLFLTNAIGYDSWPIPSVKAMQRAGALVRHSPKPLFKQVFRSFIHRGHDDPQQARQAVDVHWQHYQRADGARAFVRQVQALNVDDTLAAADRLPDLRVPARVVWGAADPFQKVAYGERFSKDLGTTLVRIEGGKHFTPEDHPGVLAQHLNELVREVAAAAGRSPPR